MVISGIITYTRTLNLPIINIYLDIHNLIT